MTLVDIALSWSPQLLHRHRGFHQPSSIKHLRYELQQKKSAQFSSKKGAKSPWIDGDTEIDG